VPGADRLLFANLVCRACACREITDLHLTFHVGDERAWRLPAYREYRRHNRRILLEGIEQLRREGVLVDHALIPGTPKASRRGRRARIRGLLSRRAGRNRTASGRT
jgi:predicted metal-binding protein